MTFNQPILAFFFSFYASESKDRAYCFTVVRLTVCKSVCHKLNM